MAFALNYLSSTELLSGTQRWVAAIATSDGTPPEHNPLPAILREHAPQAQLAVRKARDGLQDALRNSGREAEGSNDGLGLDARHDVLVRATFFILRAHALLTSDAAKRQLVDDTKKALFPTNLSITRASFAEESGEAELRTTRLTPDMRTLLGTIQGVEGTLLQHVEELEQVGRALGVTVEANAAAEAAERSRVRTPVTTAKSKLIRAIRALVETLVLNDVDQAIIDQVAGPLEVQAEAAQARALARAATRTPPTPPTPATPTT